MSSLTRSRFRTIALFFLAAVIALTACRYLRMDPPPDANKASLNGNNSCYLATASNMLAGAGYGTGTTVQQRADNIYNDMIAQFGIVNGGWIDTAMTWWLSSTHNTWTTNPFTIVTVLGNKTKIPWTDQSGPQTMGNTLRRGDLVGLSISWPRTTAGGGAYGGHAITDWGDDISSSKPLSSNPSQVLLTDSDDSDANGPIHTYSYDSYTNPNPGNFNEGNGWYFNYGANHPFIKHIATLTSAKNAAGNAIAQTVIGSYQITQTGKTSATDLHYHVGTDVNILSYRTRVEYEAALPGGITGLTDWLETSPTISEDSPRRGIQVDWDYSKKPVPYGTVLTITTDFILPYWNSISYKDVHFTYPDGIGKTILPHIKWEVVTPRIEGATRIPNVTGGYVVGSFDIIDAKEGTRIARYRFVHQYSYDQNPEIHKIRISGAKGLQISNLRTGHSYGLPSHKELWEFRNWMSDLSKESVITLDPEKPSEIGINWKGRLPYPEGDK